MPGRESALEPEPGDPLGRGTAATSHAPALSERSLKKGRKGERRKKEHAHSLSNLSLVM